MLKFIETSSGLLLSATLFSVPALADQNMSNQPNDTRICADTLYQVSHLPKDTSRLDWPKDMKFEGLSWPQWSYINPAEHLDLIEKAIQWPNARGNNLAGSLSDYYKRYGTDQQKQSIWEHFVKPYYIQMIQAHRLMMQSATISFSTEGYNLKNVVEGSFIRFKTLPTVDEIKNMSISSSDPKLNDYGWDDSSWHYVIKYIPNIPIVDDMPISLGSLPVGGELGLVGSELKLFETPGMPPQMDDIFLDTVNDETQYTVLKVFEICGIQ